MLKPAVSTAESRDVDVSEAGSELEAGVDIATPADVQVQETEETEETEPQALTTDELLLELDGELSP
jgi:hypothetical protein